MSKKTSDDTVVIPVYWCTYGSSNLKGTDLLREALHGGYHVVRADTIPESGCPYISSTIIYILEKEYEGTE
ncbi:hypothetical protein [Bifidobacterium moukalabense]|uniref:hypothetical protein n=1 Tax=Bifidobacterium moukalabense TaxID=1333651 RepID=UPI0010F5A399|nr:hypothetical protein [Bifidobacterium moukalabense]